MLLKHKRRNVMNSLFPGTNATEILKVEYPEIYYEIHEKSINIDEMLLLIEILPYIETKFINAIKEVRARTGLGLKESKDYCDSLSERYGSGRKINKDVKVKMDYFASKYPEYFI